MTPQPNPRATSRQRARTQPTKRAHLAPAWVFALVPECQIDATLLSRLVAAMAAQGTPLQAERMRFDRHYALARLAEAHCSPDAVTRQLAMCLFEVYQGSATAPDAAPDGSPA